jgi:hypothetical protein
MVVDVNHVHVFRPSALQSPQKNREIVAAMKNGALDQVCGNNGHLN